MGQDEEFNARAGQVLGGRGWQARLSRGLGVDYGTVKRWARGAITVPGYVWAVLELLELLVAAGLKLPERWASRDEVQP